MPAKHAPSEMNQLRMQIGGLRADNAMLKEQLDERDMRRRDVMGDLLDQIDYWKARACKAEGIDLLDAIYEKPGKKWKRAIRSIPDHNLKE